MQQSWSDQANKARRLNPARQGDSVTGRYVVYKLLLKLNCCCSYGKWYPGLIKKYWLLQPGFYSCTYSTTQQYCEYLILSHSKQIFCYLTREIEKRNLENLVTFQDRANVFSEQCGMQCVSSHRMNRSDEEIIYWIAIANKGTKPGIHPSLFWCQR